MADITSYGGWSFQRLGLLLRRDVAHGYRGTLKAMASAAAVILLISALSTLITGSGAPGIHYTFFSLLLFVGGFVTTSMVFRELHAGAAASSFLVLPASPLEKFASKALVTSVGYAFAALVFSTATAALSEGLNQLIFGRHHELFNPVSRQVLLSVAAYLVSQAIFLVGSIYFRKMAFIKTVGIVSALGIVVAVVSSLLAYAILRDQLALIAQGLVGGFTFAPAFAEVLSGLAKGTIPVPAAVDVSRRVLEVLYWATLAPACWVVGYLKTREKEA